jgi:hypothetical protein
MRSSSFQQTLIGIGIATGIAAGIAACRELPTESVAESGTASFQHSPGHVPGPPKAPALEVTMVQAQTGPSNVAKQWATAECPEGTTLLSGGAALTVGFDSKPIFLTRSAPSFTNGWSAIAATTDGGPDTSAHGWIVYAYALCASF